MIYQHELDFIRNYFITIDRKKTNPISHLRKWFDAIIPFSPFFTGRHGSLKRTQKKTLAKPTKKRYHPGTVSAPENRFRFIANPVWPRVFTPFTAYMLRTLRNRSPDFNMHFVHRVGMGYRVVRNSTINQ